MLGLELILNVAIVTPAVLFIFTYDIVKYWSDSVTLVSETFCDEYILVFHRWMYVFLEKGYCYFCFKNFNSIIRRQKYNIFDSFSILSRK